MTNNHRRRSSDYLVTVNVHCSLPCPTCNGGISPFDVSRRTLRKNSKYLRRRLESIERDTGSPSSQTTPMSDNDSILSFSSQLQLQHAGLGFSCRILETILRTWRAGRYEPVHPPIRAFEQLRELARALWHYECSPQPFMGFAKAVSGENWHPTTGQDARDWIFIAVVFEMPKIFGYSAMELVEFDALNSGLPHPAADSFQLPYEVSVPKYILGPRSSTERRVYPRVLTSAYDFVHDTHGRLHISTTVSIAQCLRVCFEKAGVQILLSQFAPENRPFFQSNSPATLLRILENFLQTSIGEAQRRTRPQTFLPSFSGRFAAKRRRSHAESPEDAEVTVLKFHLNELENWRMTNFGGILRAYPSVEDRFKDCRNRQLGAISESEGRPVLEMSGNGSLYEVQGSLLSP